MAIMKPLQMQQNPDLYDWTPDPTKPIFYRFDGENVIANYDGEIGKLEEVSTLPIFYIKKPHYKTRMQEIVHYINYFTYFYDLDRDTFFAIMSVKYYIDTHLDMPQKDFVNMVIDRVVTPSFVSKCKLMSCNLYKLNINADVTGKFNNTPKITNAQAFQIVAVSFCFKILTPLVLHFSNINKNFDPTKKTEYIKWFDKIFNKAILQFEKDDVPFYTSLCRFVQFRGEKLYRNNAMAFYQKKMLRGDTLELFNQALIKEVVCVKTLYKLNYRSSCVAFIDGVVHRFNDNYLKEKFVSKPFEIDSDDASKDNDESLSRAEALEMQTYKRDESAAMVADVNTSYVMNQLREWYSAFNISDEEYQYYYTHYYPNPLSEFLFSYFYASKFKDSYATINLNKEDTVFLLICMKKILQRYKMPHLAQIATAQVFTRYKKNIIKDAKSTEAFVTTELWTEVVSKKFANVMELPMKENPILQTRIDLINSSYILVDFDETIRDYRLDHIDASAVSAEYLLFLAMI